MTTGSPLFDGIAAARRRAQQKHQSPFPYRQISLLFLGIVVFFTTLLPYFNVSVANFQTLETTFHEFQKSSFVEKVPLDNPQKIPSYHMVFSTSCSEQQNWESYVVFYHAMRVRQRGNVTRIVSGCNDKEAASLTEFHDKYIAPMAIVGLQRFHLHHTPDFSRLHLSEGKNAYKYNNKPFGLRHWMENGLGLGWSSDNTTIVSSSSRHQDLLDSIVMLIDPDIILLRPMAHDFSENANQLWVDNIRPEKPYVTHGNPISQQDGYLANEWMKFDFKYITQSDDIKPPPWKEGPRHWNTGPPYLATTKDMYSIVTQWTSTAPRVLQIFPQLFAEMYGFITATVILNLPFWMTKSIVISTTIADDREGWKFIDELPDDQVCRVARTATGDIGDEYDKLPVLPNGLHYCKRYVLGKWFFSKYRVKKNIMNCDKNLFMLPPDNFFPGLDYAVYPPRADGTDQSTHTDEQRPLSKKQARREAFMLCGLMNAVNEALRYYKKQSCETPNLNETYTTHDDPSDY